MSEDRDGCLGTIALFAFIGGVWWFTSQADHKKAARLDEIENTANRALDRANQVGSDLDDVKSTLESHNID